MSGFTAQLSGQPPTGSIPIIPVNQQLPALIHTVELAAGVTAQLNVLKPQSVQITVDGFSTEARALVRLLIGPAAQATLESGAKQPAKDQELIASARPWHRLVLVEALQRWDQLPLDQHLLNAERATSRWSAARTLESGSVRIALITEALELARSAAFGLTSCVQRMIGRPGAVPGIVVTRLTRLVEDLASLGAFTNDHELSELAAIRMPESGEDGIDAIPALRRILNIGARAGDAPPDRTPVDPRLVPARLVALSLNPGRGEIELRPQAMGETTAIDIQIHAHEAVSMGATPLSATEGLLVRLVDRRTGALVTESLLELELSSDPPHEGRDKGYRFRGLLLLDGHAVDDVRADVFEVETDEPAVRDDEDPGLTKARRQSSALRQLRAVLALVRLGGKPAEIAEWLPAHVDDSSTLPDLISLAKLARPQSRDSTGAVGDPLVAELVAVHEASLAQHER